MRRSILVVSSPFFLSSNLFSMSYFFNDFRDNNSTFHLKTHIEGKANHLTFNIFKSEPISITANNKSLNAFVNLSLETYFDLDKYTIGFFQQIIAESLVNSGLNQLWYTVNQDFFTLLNNKNINNNLQTNPIEGNLVHQDFYGLYIQRKFRVNKSHFLSTKLKLNYGREINSVQIGGNTNSEKFDATLDYFYSYKNLVTRDSLDNKKAYAVGYALDIEYIYNQKNIYLYLAIFNLYSYNYWKHLAYMHYDFNSEVTYKGDDEYKHYRSFGVGYYKYDVTLKQRIPQYYKVSLNYEYNNFSFGDNLEIYNYFYTNEIYSNYKYSNSRYKVGYIIEKNTLIFAGYFQNYIFEISDIYRKNNNIIQGNLKISF